MTRKLFTEGGPNRVKSLGNDQCSMSFSIPKDEDGRVARECPVTDCSPGYFKVMLGTGITSEQDTAYCPYCRHCGEPSDFTTKEQLRYVRDLALREARNGIDEVFRDALGVGTTGIRKMGGGLISMELRYKSGTLPHVGRPIEDEVRRDVICPHCSLDQTVFGLATWCADCGEDIFMVHVAAELQVTRLMINDVSRREELLGKRVAAKDVENCLEDAVSIFEAALRAIVRRALIERHESQAQIDSRFKKMGNSFQSITRTREQLSDLFGIGLNSDVNWEHVSALFEKRHPVAHNLGVVDRKYLERVQEAESEGREIRIGASEVLSLLMGVHEAIASISRDVIGSS